MTAFEGTSSSGIVIGVLGEQREPREAILSAITDAGAAPEVLTEATAISKVCAVDALLFDAGRAPERLVPTVASLSSDPRSCFHPRVLVVDGAVTAGRLAEFGAATLVLETELHAALGPAVADLVAQVRVRNDVIQAAQAAGADLRLIEQMLATVQHEGVTLSHDVRVLFGVILGFASNLRDGFGGPVTEIQHRQLVNIIEASADASALLERYVTDLRRLVPPSADSARRTVPRVASRRHIELGELARGIVGLFQDVADHKQIRLYASTTRSVYAWCDAMQVKQALVNLVSNALKFTPTGGTVEVAVRPGPPASARGGASPRRDVEIVVKDSGPGIPPHERERIFERGVRLERDVDVPGTGVGLAVVRDIITLHGGLVRVDDSERGGSSITLVLPADLRARVEDQARMNGAATARMTSTGPSSPDSKALRRDPE